MGFNSFWVSINHQRFMHVTQCLQIIIARPAVGVRDGSFATFSRTNFVKLLASRFGTGVTVIDQHKMSVLPP